MSIKSTLGRITLLIVALLVVSWLSVPVFSVVLAEVRLLLWSCLLVAVVYGWMVERAAPEAVQVPVEYEYERGR